MLFRSGSAGENSTCNVGDLGLIPGLGRSPGEGNNYPLQYAGQENPRPRLIPSLQVLSTGCEQALLSLGVASGRRSPKEIRA